MSANSTSEIARAIREAGRPRHRPPALVTIGVGWRQEKFTRADALKPVRRWIWAKKYLVCEAIRLGLISFTEATLTHDLSSDELVSWLLACREHGPRALIVTRLPLYRRAA